MGMGTAPQCGWLISLDRLREICPHSVASVEQAHDFNSWAMLAQTADIYGLDALSPQLNAALADLKLRFELMTGGLRLSLSYYDSDYGDKYDEIPDLDVPGLAGCLFLIDGMTQMTPAGQALQDKIEFKQWVVYG